MNEQILKEEAYVLIRKVQVAVAIYIKQSCPPNKDLAEYALQFQNEYRKESKRCNLELERKILIDQIQQLEPRARHFLQKSERYPLPMEIDNDTEIDPIYVEFSLNLLSATELLDAVNEVRNFFRHYQIISTIDVLFILSKFSDLNAKLKQYDKCTQKEIPVSVFKQTLRETDINKVAEQCITSIAKLFESYLFQLPKKSSPSHEEALNRMKKANHVMIKCVAGFAYEGHYQNIIVDLVHDSIKHTFLENYTKTSHFHEYRTQIVRKWKSNKLLCANALNVFTQFLGNCKTLIAEDFDKYENIIKFTESFLETYCKIHVKKTSSQSSQESMSRVQETPEFQRQNKITVSEKYNLKFWGKSLAKFLCAVDNKNSRDIKIRTLSCLKIVLPTGEFKSIYKNYQSKKR